MIRLAGRGGSEIHVLSALLDYCTAEGGLDGYPVMEPGSNLHNHMDAHNTVVPFYEDYNLTKVKNDNVEILAKVVHLYGDPNDLRWNKCIDQRFIPKPSIDTQLLANVARDNFGKMLMTTIDMGKTLNKQLPPDDQLYDYGNCISLADKIEKIALALVEILRQDADQFHIHPTPDHCIDIQWYWTEPTFIIRTIQDCGWTPLNEKVEIFCKNVAKFNELYYNVVRHSFDVYENVVQKTGAPCELTFFETAMIHALLIEHYSCSTKDIKLIHTIPKHSDEFYKFYNIR